MTKAEQIAYRFARFMAVLCYVTAAVGWLAGAYAYGKSKAGYTFDEHSFKEAHYNPADCTRTGDEMVCKKARLRFDAIKIVATDKPAQTSETSQDFHSNAPQAKPGSITILFDRKGCKAVPLKAKRGAFVENDEWECKNVKFRWNQ